MLRVIEDGKGGGHLVFLIGVRISRNNIDCQRYGCQDNNGMEKQHGVNIMAMEVQIGMTLDVTGEEVVGPGRVEMVMNVSGIKAMLNVTSVVNLVTTTMSVRSGRNKRQI